MGDVSISDLLAVATYTRLGVLAHQLGIDPFQLESSRKQLTPGVNAYARVWLDADFRRLALRTFVVRPDALTRPGSTYLELETNPDTGRPDTTLLVVGPRPLDQDLLLLGKPETGTQVQAVVPGVIEGLRAHLAALGDRPVAVLGQRLLPNEANWLLGFELGTDSAREVSMIAESIGIEPYQLMMLGALHGDLAAKGCLATVGCRLSSIRRELTIEYRDLSWPQVISTTNRLRAIKSEGGFGVLAGAFSAERAAYLEITFRSDQVARVRAAIEVVSNVA
jgi:hypothetical protein